MRPHTCIRCVFTACALAAFAWTVAARPARDRSDIDEVVARVAERLSIYYNRACQLVCVERSTVIAIGSDWSSQGFARSVESELRVEMDGVDGTIPEPRVRREIRRVNGREPRPRDRTERSGCTDPTPLSPEPLAFLLPPQRDEYKFTAMRDGRDGDRAALIIEFAVASGKSRPELIEDELGHKDCFDWKGPLAIAGRVWVDPRTYDVLRLERRIAGPTDVRVPLLLQRKYNFPGWLTLDRDDLTLRYREIVFSDPEETLVLPQSIEATTVFRSGLQSIRRTQTFSDYRRFLTDSRIKRR